MIVQSECGEHRAGDGSYLLYDMNDIPCKRVCPKCHAEVVARSPMSKLERGTVTERALARVAALQEEYVHLNLWSPA